MVRETWLGAAALALAACSPAGEARPQILLVVDTDAALVGMLAADPELSREAAVDAVRVDFVGDAGELYAWQTLVAPDPGDLPLSLGIATPDGGAGTAVTVRLRAFATALSTMELVQGRSELLPRPEASIDRLVRLTLPGEGVLSVRVVLSLACFGAPASFFPPATCVDAERPAADPTAGVEPVDEAGASLAGSSPLARSEPCSAAPEAERLCVPGGVALLGSLELAGLFDPVLYGNPVPLQPVHLSPFWLDRQEVTVGRFNALVTAGLVSEPLPDTEAENPLCTWRGASDPSHDSLPLNCVGWSTARQVCALGGGDLPSEAEWEYAASGRGEGRSYPWGEAYPTCCAASLARGQGCPGPGVEPVGSHPPAACGGVGDVSRDGVEDLGGSLAELARDAYSDYADDECWRARRLLHDPVCDVPGALAHSERGGHFSSGLDTALAAIRRNVAAPEPFVGFRCAYGDAP